MAPAKELPKGQDDQSAPPKKKSRFKLIMFLCSLLLLITGIIGGGYWWLYLRPGAEGLAGLFGGSEQTEQVATGDTPKAGSEKGTATGASGGEKKNEAKAEGKSSAKAETPLRPAIKPVALPTLTVNLADPAGNRYLKIGMEVEVNAPDAVSEIEAQNARVRDAIILLLSGKRVENLASAEGKIQLKNEVAARLNQILGAQRVVRIYFTDFVIQ